MEGEKVGHRSQDSYNRRQKVYKEGEGSESNLKGFFEESKLKILEVQCDEEVELTNEKGKAYTEMQYISEDTLVSKMKEYLIRDGVQFTYSNLKEQEEKIDLNPEKEQLL